MMETYWTPDFLDIYQSLKYGDKATIDVCTLVLTQRPLAEAVYLTALKIP